MFFIWNSFVKKTLNGTSIKSVIINFTTKSPIANVTQGTSVIKDIEKNKNVSTIEPNNEDGVGNKPFFFSMYQNTDIQ